MSIERKAQLICDLLQAAQIPVNSEEVAQRRIRALLKGVFDGVQREVKLSSSDRVDFMVQGVAVEVKVRKGQSRMDVAKQLQRYATHPEVEAVILASADSWPSTFKLLNEKPFYFANLSRGWL